MAAKDCYEKLLGACLECNNYRHDHAHSTTDGVLFIKCDIAGELVQVCQKDSYEKCMHLIKPSSGEIPSHHNAQHGQVASEQTIVVLDGHKSAHISVLC